MPESKSRQCSGSADTDLSTLEAPDDHANAISADPMWKMACAGHCMDICQPGAIVFRPHGLIKQVCANCATTGRPSSSWRRLPRVWHACMPLLRDHERLQAAGTLHKTHGRGGHTRKSRIRQTKRNPCKLMVSPAVTRTRPQIVLWICNKKGCWRGHVFLGQGATTLWEQEKAIPLRSWH